MLDQDLPNTVQIGRQLNEMALLAGRKRQSSQTGYVHHFYSNEAETPQTIPVVENIYFALSLLRTKTSEQMSEAKDLLERLLFFQVEGNFPIYIHEFPHCKDRFLGAQILPALFYILEEFQSVLGAELKQRIQKAAHQLIYFNLHMFEEKSPSYGIGMKIAASAKVFGRYFGEPNLETKGEQLLSHYHSMGIQPAWCVPSSIADICTALQLVFKKISDSPWNHFFEHLLHTWHRPTRTYIGPGLKQFQQGEEPQPNLYDLFLGYFSEGFSARALKDAPYHLSAILIRQTEELLPNLNLPAMLEGNLNESKWAIYQHEQFAYSLINKSALLNQAHENAFHPLNLIWGNFERVHTFVCQGGNFESFDFIFQPNEIQLFIKLIPNFELEDREKCREISFFFDMEKDVKMTIQGEVATTFGLEEEFALVTSQIQLSLLVALAKGEGQFLGHLMKGNRLSQILTKGEHRYKAFDWQIFFRTLRRLEHCEFKVTLQIRPC